MNLRRLIFLGIAVAAVLANVPPAGAQPNLVFILTDDQRPDTIEVMPKTRAAFGVEFTRFAVTTPNCCPSRSSFLTGRWTHSTGVHATSRRGYEAFRDDEPESLGPWLQARGYVTGFVGKYFNGFRANDPVPPGWDEYYGRLYGGYTGNGQTTFGMREYRAAEGASAVVQYPNETYPEAYSTRVFGDLAVGFIRRATNAAFNPEGRPFALFLWTTGVNSTIVESTYADAALPGWVRPPSFFERRIRDKPMRIQRQTIQDVALAEKHRAAQLRQSMTIDDEIAEIVTLLDELGIRNKTVGILASDNGRMWGEHRLVGKWVAYEEAVRVPFRLMLPSGQAFTVPALAANVDVAPTIMQLAGDTTDRYEGRSLVGLLGNPTARFRSRLLLELYARGWCALRSHRWKYVQHRNGEEELYELHRDPYELRNRARWRRYRDEVRRFRGAIRRSACRPPRLVPLRG